MQINRIKQDNVHLNLPRAAVTVGVLYREAWFTNLALVVLIFCVS